jgi:hypothetical protein
MRKVSRLAGSYRIILGDTCTICRAVSRISFPEDRPPELPIAGCRAPEGCRCKLPMLTPQSPVVENVAAVETAAPVVTAPAPTFTPQPAIDWNQPAPITQIRRTSLAKLRDLYQQQLIQGVRVVTAPNCCPVCQEVAASIYSPSIAPPIPIAGCTDGWNCRCMYAEQPLPLDERGRRAMRRIEAIERERELRRAGIPIGGPRWLHLTAIGLAIIIGVASLAAPDHSKSLFADIALAACAATVAVLALRRVRPVPSPPWTYVACGAGIVLLAFTSVDAVLSEGLGILQQGLTFAESNSGSLWAVNGAPATDQAVLIAGGLALLLLGLVDPFIPERIAV